MSDFHQQGIITTLHDLRSGREKDYPGKLEDQLQNFARRRRIALLLPCHVSELENREVLDRILAEIAQVSYLHRVIVALGGGGGKTAYVRAAEAFKGLQSSNRELSIVWVSGERVGRVLDLIDQRKIPVGMPGKGQSVWVSLGYIFARGDCDVVALHDCDILTYDRILLGRLIEPVANPNNEFEFCKGYYSRISMHDGAMKGRVTRLFVTPFLDALSQLGDGGCRDQLQQFIRYHQTFRYPLAGEFSMTTRLAQGVNLAYDWGLEVSTLSEVYERIVPRKIAQIDLCCTYDHKHQEMSVADASRGLHRMVVDIAKFYLNYIRANGMPLDTAVVEMLRQSYYRNALRFVKIYSDDAEVNGLGFDRYEEEMTIRYFRDFVGEAWREIEQNPVDPSLPSWNRVFFGIPNVYELLREAVSEDQREYEANLANSGNESTGDWRRATGD